MRSFERYQAKTSPVHRLAPQVKLGIVVFFILSNVLLPDGAWKAFGASWGFVAGCSLAAGVGAGYLLRRSFIVLPFALAAVTVVFSTPGNTLVHVAALTVTDAGLVRFSSILLRSWLSVQMAVLLTATTRFPDLVHALRRFHVPGILTGTAAFMYRYLGVLGDEAFRLMRARDARSACAAGDAATGREGGSLRWRAKIAGNMGGQLFLRSFLRSERVVNAMLSRGYQGTYLPGSVREMQKDDWVRGILAVFLIGAIQAAAWLFPG